MEQVLIRAELFIQVGLDCGLMRHNTLKLSIVGRVDYVDEDYEKLAVKAQTLIEKDVELQKHYFQRCFTFCTDGKPDEFDEVWNQIFNKVKNEQPSSMWNELKSHEEVFHDLHGNNAWPIEESNLGRVRRWVKGYSSKRCATVNAGAMIKVYYGRCRTKSNITFILGKPVDRLWYNRNRASVKGVVLENGLPLRADSTILATGAWSSLLVRLDQQMEANAVPIAYIRLIPEEYEQYKDIACHTNLSTGFNLFTPIGGLLKILRRLAGVQNTTTLKDPDDPAKTYRVSYPKTKVDDPLQWISTEIEQSFRDELKEIFPPLADRPFENIRFCWFVSVVIQSIQACD